MKILIRRGPKRWLLCWKPVKGRSFYLINFNNVIFCGFPEEIRGKINELLQGKTSQAEFEAYYCKEIKILALWS